MTTRRSTARRYLQLDVFADRPGAGNPLAVVLDGDGLDDATMQAIARWTRLPETTFVFPATQPEASYGIRIFSPRREVPFAGHPSVGTAHAVLEAGLATPRDGLLVQEGIAGLLPLRVTGSGPTRTIAVRTPRAKVMEIATPDDARLRDVLGTLPLGALPPALLRLSFDDNFNQSLRRATLPHSITSINFGKNVLAIHCSLHLSL